MVQQAQSNSDLFILVEAQSQIYGEKRDAYGHPLDNFQTEADILRALVKARYGVDIAFTPDFIGLVKAVALKGAREAKQHLRDNLLDMAGYAGCTQEVFDEQARRACPTNQTLNSAESQKILKRVLTPPEFRDYP